MYIYSLRRELLRSPFIRILIAFMAGIICSDIIIHRYILVLLFGTTLVALIFFALKNSFSKSYILRNMFGILVFIIFFLFGMCLDKYNKQSIYFNHENEIVYAKAVYTGKGKKLAQYEQLKVKITNYRYDNTWHRSSFNTIIYTTKQKRNEKLKSGDRILIKAKIKPIEDNTNPHSFNYAEYLRRKYTAYSCFVDKQDIIILDEDSFSINYYLNTLRQKIESIYHKAGLRGDLKQIFLALSIGQKKDLSSMLRQRWVDAGSIHVLAVSGLHVGLIYIILNFAFSFLNKLQSLKAILIIIFLCFYALLTGLSPSVCRATFMFSFIIIGRSISRQGNIYNSLTASAFFMLLTDTNLIYDLGFQLSYTAVLSIVFFYPRLSGLISFKNVIINKIYQFIILSLSAQILSFPILIYHFNQYPTYSILSNFIAIPLAMILIYASISLMIFSYFQSISFLIVSLVDIIYYYSNIALKYIVDMPGSILRNIVIDQYQLILIYLILICISLLFVLRWRRAFIFILFFIFLFQLETIRINTNIPSNEIISFQAGQNSLLSLKSGDRLTLIHNFNINRDYMYRTINAYALKNKIKTKIYYSPSENIIFSLNDKSLLFLVNDVDTIHNNLQLSINTIVLSGKLNLSIENLKNINNTKEYISTGGFYSENKSWYEKRKSKYPIIHSSKYKAIIRPWR